jgi:hypothetical protein
MDASFAPGDGGPKSYSPCFTRGEIHGLSDRMKTNMCPRQAVIGGQAMIPAAPIANVTPVRDNSHRLL